MATYFRLDAYDEDGVLLTDFSTDPAHDRPYLREPENLVGQELDLAAGSSKISGVNIEIVDVPGTPGDNDSGVVTAILPTISKGTRAQLLKSVDGAAYVNVLRGVWDSVNLHGSYSSFVGRLRDERENERRTRAFTRCTSASVMPRGVIAGFGYIAESDTWLIPPVTPFSGTLGTFTDITVSHKRLTLAALPRDTQGRLTVTDADVDRIITDKMRAQFVLDGTAGFGTAIAPRIRLLWRAAGGGAYSAIEDVGGFLLQSILGFTIGVYKGREVYVLQHIDFDWPVLETPPANGTPLEFIIGYAGPASEEYPFHFEGTAGELLAGIYDGDFSHETGPAIEYDAAAVAAMDAPVRARITEPLDDADGVWKWVQENIYAPFSFAPALNEDGAIAPVSAALPDASEELLELDDTNCEPVPGWGTDTQSAVNVVDVYYPRIFRVEAPDDPLQERSGGDGLGVKWTHAHHWVIASIAQIGEHPLKLECETLAALAGIEGQLLVGDISDEYGAQVAARKGPETTDRFAYGAQTFGPIRILESAWGTRRAGAFVLANCSWWPNFGTGTRGANRLAQIVNAHPTNDGWVEVTAIDCGNEAAPVDAPTIGAATVTDEIVSFDVTPAAGTEARAEYAVSPTLPANDSPLWRFIGRDDELFTASTPPLPSGSVVWRRARGEQVNRRPSAWINGAGSSTITAVPRLTHVRLFVGTDGSVRVVWESNATTLGVEIRWSLHSIGGTPSYGAAVDVDAADGEYDIPVTLQAGQQISVEVTPYPGWDGTSVTGTAGVAVVRTAEVGADAVAQILDYGPIHSDPTGDTVTHYGIIVGSEVWAYEKVVQQPVPSTVWDTLEDESNLSDVLIPDSNRRIEDTYTAPDEGWLRYVLWRPFRVIDGVYQAGNAIKFVVFDKKAQRPEIEHDQSETGETGTLWISVQERGIPVDSVEVQTRTDVEPYSDYIAPLRDAGDASTVRGGTLGAGEYEHDVPLALTRQSFIRFTLTLQTGERITIESPGFDRNREPDFGAEPFVEGTTIYDITGDHDTVSLRVERLGSSWKHDVDFYASPPIDVTVADPDGNAGQSNNTVETYRISLYSDPIDDIDGTTLIETRELQVTVGTSGEPSWDEFIVSIPLEDSQTLEIELEASAAPVGYSVAVWRRYQDGGDPWTDWVDITASLSPAPTTPPTSLTSYFFSTGFVRESSKLNPILTYEIRAEILDAGDVVVESQSQTRQWRHPGPEV